MCSKFYISVRRGQNSGGFTLSEMMMAVAIGTAIIGSVVVSSVELYEAFSAGYAYRNVHENARSALVFLTRDLRATTNLVSFASNSISMDVLNSSGGVTRVQYSLSGQNLIRTATTGASVDARQLTDNVTSVLFERWTKPGTPATTTANTYEIRASLTISNVSAFRSSRDFIQTRIRMRNKT